MVFGNDPHHVQAQAEVQLMLRPPMGHHGIEKGTFGIGRQHRSPVGNGDLQLGPGGIQLHADRAVRAMKIDSVVDDLVEQLLDPVVRGMRVNRVRTAAKNEFELRVG